MTKRLQPGQRVRHSSFGEGVIVTHGVDGSVRVFFSGGERQVPPSSIEPARTRSEAIVSHTAAGVERQRRAWLCWQAHALPLMDSASALTSARIDLLPHQVVLTHRVVTSSPRRFLVADEVGLGKTIETALILRELMSRGELRRALVVVPAGLVNNWHRELNEVFHLNFEVFGSEGDVTDRKSNAFEKHDFLIASIDTLKLRARVAKLKAAPPWDLIVFDEAHHLSAYRQNGKITKTLNYRLAEMLRAHSRDLMLLSATPHQGDHFRFWMLVQLLDSTLFQSPVEMVNERHRQHIITLPRGVRKRNIYEEVARLMDIPGRRRDRERKLCSAAEVQLLEHCDRAAIRTLQRGPRSSRGFREQPPVFLMRQNDRADLDDISDDIDLSDVTKKTILSYPLPDQQPAEKYRRVHLPAHRRSPPDLRHRSQRCLAQDALLLQQHGCAL